MFGILLLLGAVPQELTDESFDAIRDYVLPTADEARFLEIPWRPTMWEAVVEAARDDRPVLLWAMNGHPLACT